MLMGIANTLIIGLIKVFTSPSISPAKNAI